jgi:hypothetical protein
MSGRFRVFDVCVRAVLSVDARQVDEGMHCAEIVWCGCEL